MPLLTITNLQTSPITFQDSTGLTGFSVTVPGSGAVTNKAVSLDTMAGIEAQLIAETTAGNVTWAVTDDPNSSVDTLPEHATTATATPYNAVAGDQDILCNRGTSGAMSVVLSAAAKIGQAVKVVDVKGDAGTNNITITVASSGTINGGSSVVINTNNGWALLLKTGTTAWVSVLSTQISTSAAGGDLTGNYPNPTLNGMFASAPQALSGAGSLDVTKRTTLFTSTGAGNALSLPNGTKAGQKHAVIHTVKGASGTGVITPVSAGNFATCTLTAKWDWAEFEWSGSVWNVIAAGGAFSGLA